jgi:hypothetical protein
VLLVNLGREFLLRKNGACKPSADYTRVQRRGASWVSLIVAQHAKQRKPEGLVHPAGTSHVLGPVPCTKPVPANLAHSNGAATPSGMYWPEPPHSTLQPKAGPSV